MPRPLCDVRNGHTRTDLFGEPLAHPIVLAPIAYQRLYHPDGELASMMAADAQDGQAVISTLASRTFECIAQAAGRPLWFQLYWQGERASTRRVLERALAAGVRVVVFTVDAPVKQGALALPAGISAVNLDSQPKPVSTGAGQSIVFDGWMAQAPTWDDLAWLRDQTTLPLVIKGVLHPDDAIRAANLGCDGVIVSNHGGRVLASAPSGMSALPAIVEAVGKRIPVLLDSGVDSGRDVYCALSEGARAVLIGRPYIWGLAGNGAMGVAHVIRMLRDELEHCMALCGKADLGAIRS